MLKVDSFHFFRQYLVERKYNNSDTHVYRKAILGLLMIVPRSLRWRKHRRARRKRSDLRRLFLTVSEVESFCAHCGLFLIRVIRRVPRLMSMMYAFRARRGKETRWKRPRALRDDSVQQNSRSFVFDAIRARGYNWRCGSLLEINFSLSLPFLALVEYSLNRLYRIIARYAILICRLRVYAELMSYTFFEAS